jgi:hypothetical protein
MLTVAANSCTNEDLPMPRGPQIKTGRTIATFNKRSGSCMGVTVIAVFIVEFQ